MLPTDSHMGPSSYTFRGIIRPAHEDRPLRSPPGVNFAFLVWDSVRARHTAIAETAVRPSQGRRSRNVITMVALP